MDGTVEGMDNRNRIEADKLKKIVAGLRDVRADEYQDWIRVCWAKNNLSVFNDFKRKGKNLIHKFSQRSMKYNDIDVERFYDSIPYRKDGLGLGFLLSCLKHDNIAELKKVVKEINNDQMSIFKI